jgi:hypothetical protein
MIDVSRRVTLHKPALLTVSRSGSGAQADVLIWRMSRVWAARDAKKSSSSAALSASNVRQAACAASISASRSRLRCAARRTCTRDNATTAASACRCDATPTAH